jgi:hypothetical protein
VPRDGVFRDEHFCFLSSLLLERASLPSFFSKPLISFSCSAVFLSSSGLYVLSGMGLALLALIIGGIRRGLYF